MEDTTAALGGLKGQSATYSIEVDKLEREIPVEEPITATLCTANKVIYATSQGSVKAYEGGEKVADVTEHAGAATALSAHPGGQIVASVGTDKSLVLYESQAMKRVARTYTDSCEWLTFPT